MGIVGWTHHARDLRYEQPTITAMAGALGAATTITDTAHLGRHAALACRGNTAVYGDWRHPERSDPDLMVAIDGRLTNRARLEHQLRRPRRPASDADVVIHAYRRWGINLVNQVEGSYAVAIWDEQRRRLLLLRDPLGVKTWFWRTVPDGGLLFATSTRALLACPGVTAQVDAEGLNELLTMGAVRTPGHAVVRGIRELPPGHLAQVTPDQISTYPYWRWHADRHGYDVDTAVKCVRRALADITVPLREQPAGAVLLSGGIASAAAAAVTNPLPAGAARPTAYVLTLAGPWSQPPGAGVDLNAAARTATHLRLRREVVGPRGAALHDAAADLHRVLDFPGDPSTDTVRLALLRRVAADTSSVVTGDGAAAVFGDYPWHHRDLLAGDSFPWHRGDLTPVDLLSGDARLQLLPAGYAKQRYADATTAIRYPSGDDATGRAHRRAAHLTLTHYLPALLRRLDQLATAAGLTVHTPFTDLGLAAYLFGLPYPVRHLTGVRLGLLRHAAADLLPASVVWQPSEPFPATHQLPGWRRTQRAQLRNLITDPAQPLQPLLDTIRITDLLAQPAEQLPRGWHTSVAYLLDVNAWLSQHHITLA